MAGSEDSLSWRDEISTVLQEWIALPGGEHGAERWQRVGSAQPTGKPGVYVVDIRGSNLTADQADSLRLAGQDGRSVRDGFAVMEASVDGELLRVRVAEFAAPGEPHVWRLRQRPIATRHNPNCAQRAPVRDSDRTAPLADYCPSLATPSAATKRSVRTGSGTRSSQISRQ